MVESEIFEQRNKRLRNKKQANYRKRQKTRYYETNKQNNNNTKRHKLGRMDRICIHCGAKFWIEEKDCNSSQTSPSAVLVVKLIYHLCLNHHHIY